VQMLKVRGVRIAVWRTHFRRIETNFPQTSWDVIRLEHFLRWIEDPCGHENRVSLISCVDWCLKGQLSTYLISLRRAARSCNSVFAERCVFVLSFLFSPHALSSRWRDSANFLERCDSHVPVSLPPNTLPPTTTTKLTD